MDANIRTMTLDELSAAIREWALDRNLIEGPDSAVQCCKTIEELADTIVRQKPAETIAAIGDVYVALAILWAQHDAWIEVDYHRVYNQLDIDPITTASYTPKKLLLALAGHIGEVAASVNAGLPPYETHEIGLHILCALTQLAHLHSTTLSECVAAAYAEIKDHKGKMVDGVFVREAG